MTVSVNITGLEPIAAAINSLAQAMGANGVTVAVGDRRQEASQPVADPAPALSTAAIPAAPAPASVPAPPSAVPVAQQAVPTSTTAYTADDLAKAAISLMDAGRQNELIALLQQFGVAAVPNLLPAQYGAFATALRGMGAQI